MYDLRAANVKCQKEWDSDSRISLTYRACELAGELGEALNVLKKIERENLGLRGSRATVDDLADELADVIICVDLLMMDLDIDMHAAVSKKFNQTSKKYNLKTRMKRMR